MAIEQYFQESGAQNDFGGKDGGSFEKWNSVLTPVDENENSSSGGFECNICLDSAQDPVVTFCGHLFCWPCVYKWINFQATSTENKQPRCPVCKTEISQKTIVPLYGRDESRTKSSKTKNRGITVPRRPTTTPRHHHSYPNHTQINRLSPVLSFGDVATTDAVHPIVGMFGEMVYSRIFGNSETFYTYPNSYQLAGNNSPRVRRHLMQADQSLGRVCFFLFCCMVLCLILF